MTTDDLDTLWDEAEELPEGPAKLTLQEEVIRRADAANDVDAAFRFRVDLMGTALNVGRGDVMGVAFSWCVAKYDEDPDRFGSDFDLLWRYRWVISELCEYHYIPLAHLDALVADMRARYERAGVSLRAFHLLRLNVAHQLWGPAVAAECHRAWRQAPTDAYADDRLTERVFDMTYDDDCGRPAGVIAKGRRLLKSPGLSEFHAAKVRTRMLVPLTLAGEAEEATAYQRASVRRICQTPRFSYDRGEHIKFLALTGDLTAAVKLVEDFLPLAADWIDPWGQFRFYGAAAFLFRRVAAAGRRVRRLRVPPTTSPVGRPDTTAPAELADWFGGKAGALADLFEARSPTGYASGILKRLDELV